MRLEDMREQFPKMPESMKQMIEQEVTVQIGQEKENDNPKVVTYKKRKKKNMAHPHCDERVLCDHAQREKNYFPAGLSDERAGNGIQRLFRFI